MTSATGTLPLHGFSTSSFPADLNAKCLASYPGLRNNPQGTAVNVRDQAIARGRGVGGERVI